MSGYAARMGIGIGIFLVALGAILTFAVHWHIAGLDLRVVGWVLMLAGAAGVILFFAFWNRRGNGRVVTQRQSYGPAGQPLPPTVAEPRAYESERRVYEEPPAPPG